MANVYVRLAAIEVRLAAGGESWNQEPLNPASHKGPVRSQYGCYTSRTVGQVNNTDTSATLELFR